MAEINSQFELRNHSSKTTSAYLVLENMSDELTDPANAIRVALESLNPPAVVAEYVLERIPHIFNQDWSLYRKWRAELGSRLGVDPCDISITGSACVGVSLSPRKNFSLFHDRSDIDVAVVSPYHFDVAWRCLRAFRLADARNNRERQAVIRHRENYIYWGCIATDRILRIMPFVKDWLIASSDMGGIKPTEGRDVNFRIYRDYESLRSYQTNGVRTLQAQILESR
jgi:hypothetical protein